MKLTQILFKQHIGRQRRLFWYIQGKRTLVDLDCEKILNKHKKVSVIQTKDYLRPPSDPNFKFPVSAFVCPTEPALDNTHPDWHDRPCFILRDDDLLTLGIPQAQQITKTIVFENDAPKAVKSLAKDISIDYHELAKRTIQTAVTFDAYQEKLPKLKNPDKLTWNYPRQLGITSVRKVSNLSKKLTQLCECISGPEIANSRSIIDDAFITFPFERELDLFSFNLTMDIVLMSNEPLKPAAPVTWDDCNNMEIPDIHPVHCSIGFEEENIYKINNHYPLKSGVNKKHIHTIFVYHDPTRVKHKSELEHGETQIFARALMKAFTAAASSARQKYGLNVKELPEPITIQCIYSDGEQFYFSIYQLNTLNIDDKSGIKNYFWSLPKLDLYKKCGYVLGKPVLEGYNPDVFKMMLAFYKNN